MRAMSLSLSSPPNEGSLKRAPGEFAPTDLTPRELQVLDLLARGFRYGEIARLLSIGLTTVQSHVKRIYPKLGTHTCSGAVFQARRLGLLDSELFR